MSESFFMLLSDEFRYSSGAVQALTIVWLARH